MGKVCVYCRVANENQMEMDKQRKMIYDYCENKGLKVDECFCDNGVSGLKYDRDGLSKMFKVIQNGDMVVVKDIARISRNADQCMYFVEQIQKAGATLVIVDQPDLKFDAY
jgi:DNA invertase Pin-like site-specific DNA recombinase